MSRKYFGTDGIRGRVGSFPITPEFVLKLGWAVGRVFSEEKGRARVLIGKDTRISGYMFESALEAGLVAAGVDVSLLGPMPTPAIAYLTRTFRCQAGIVISASHNPFDDNGIKFFGADGRKLSDEIEAAIEAQLDEIMQTVDSSSLGKVNRIFDAEGRYVEYCKSTVPAGFKLSGMRIVLDCAHGATYSVAPKVFHELGAEVETIGNEPDGLNINNARGSMHPEALRECVLNSGAALGIAFDGDGDRVLFIDETGAIVDGDELLFVIAQDQLRTHGHCEGVVGTLMSNMGFELALQELNIPFTRARVGDRYVNELMQSHGWALGGENSGHVICADVSTTGDGIVAALKVLLAVAATGKSLSELTSGMTLFPQTMINVRVADKVHLDDHPLIAAAVADIEQRLDGKGRVLLRPSGTEPVIRVMVEGENAELVEACARELADAVAKALA